MLSTDHENTLMCLLLKKIKFSKFYHVSDQTRFLCVILSDFDQVLCDLKVSKSEIDLWGIPGGNTMFSYIVREREREKYSSC